MHNYTTEELISLAKEHILYTTNRPDIVMEKGSGMYLWDTEGKKYLDFVGGWAVNSLGHSPKVISDALAEQSVQLVNASPSYYNVPMIRFAQLLIENSCFHRVFFASSGAEANESAIKLARKYGAVKLNGAYEIITATHSFHGRTLATMAATGKKHWEELFMPRMPGFVHVPYNDLDAINFKISDKTCAIMLEPIQGEGGVHEADYKYIKALRKLCDENGILLIFDEIQTGIGRTGKMFAYEHYDVEPDIMTLAKGIGGGFPLSAMLTKEKFNIFEAGDQGGTYTFQPLAMAVGYAVVNEIIKSNIPENARIQGEYLKSKLDSTLTKEFGIHSIRGQGLLVAFDLPKECGQKVVSEALEEGLLLNSPNPTTIRLMPPLIVTQTEIDMMIDIVAKVLKRVI